MAASKEFKRILLDSLLSRNILGEDAIDDVLGTLPLNRSEHALAKSHLLHKLENFNVLNSYDYTIVSLGTQCLPNTITTRWGIKPSKAMGETRKPFDLSVHPLPVIHRLLSTEFNNYRATGIHQEHFYYINKKRKIIFNHDFINPKLRGKSDETLRKRGVFKRFRNTLQIRSRNLLASLQAGNCLAVLCLLPRDMAALSDERTRPAHVKAIEEINEKLRNYAGSNRLACVCPCHGEEAAFDVDVDHVYRFVLPHQEYVWSEPRFWFTRDGLGREKALVDFLVAIIRETMPLRSSPRYDSSVFELYKSSSDLNYLLSRAHAYQKDYGAALEKVRKAIALRGNDPRFHMHLGKVLQDAGDSDAAAAAYEEAMELAPGMPDPHYQRSRIYWKQGETAKAIAKARDALALEAEEPDFFAILGRHLKKLGDREGARLAAAKAQAMSEATGSSSPNGANCDEQDAGNPNLLQNALRQLGQLSKGRHK